MKENIVQKFCRDCYTTTTHKVLDIKDSKNERSFRKTLCLKCAESQVHKRRVPKKKVSYEDILEI